MAVSLGRDGHDCVVEALLISCPVLGKRVEEATIRRIVEEATADGCERIRFPHRDTGRNHLAIEFLTSAATRPWGDTGSEPAIYLEAAV